MRPVFREALEKLADGGRPGREEVLALLQASPGEEEESLFRAADAVRRRVVGDEVHLRGVIEFSNHCRRHCLYCGIRADNRRLERYRMQPAEIVAAARRGVELGYKTIVLQSGEDPWYTRETLAEIIRSIKEWGVAVTLCVGERPREDYACWREAGADRYLLKHETANPRLYARLHPGMHLADRLNHLRWLKELGYQVGAGNIVGLPGQTLADLADDLLLLRDLRVEMAGIGPFIPHPDTPLGQYPPGSVSLTLRVLAVARLLLPWCHLPATTALATLNPEARRLTLLRGANVVMPNLTPARYRRNYEIYPNKICLDEDPGHCRLCLHQLVSGLGRRLAAGPGHGLLSGRPDTGPA